MNNRRRLRDEITDMLKRFREPESIILIASSLLLLTHQTFFRRTYIRSSILPGFGIKSVKGEPSELYPYAIWALGSFLIYFVLPLLLIRLVHRRRPADFGVGLGDARAGIKIIALFSAVMIPLTVLAGLAPDICNAIGWRGGAEALDVFAKFYPQVKWINPSLVGRPGVGAPTVIGRLLLVHSFLFLYFVGWEFIFRGYMLFGLYQRFGYQAVLISNIPFVVLHYSKPFPEAVGAVVAGIALCVLAIRARSFWPCVFVHFIVASSMEFVVVLRSLA